LTKKEVRQADEEWVVVGLKGALTESQRVLEKGWIVVAEKPKAKATAEDPERVDKLLASHGYCKRSEVKSWLRHGRVTFEGELVRKLDQKVVVRLYDGVLVDGKPIPVAPKVTEKENGDGEAGMDLAF